MGRAGRKRDGQIHVFMTEGREDGNWDSALSSHQDMQSEIITGRNIELYDDVERLLPEGCNPTCVEQVLSIDPYEPEDKAHNKGKRKSAANAQTPKAKRARGEPVPEGALDGFILASSLTKNGKKLASKSKKKGRLGVRKDLLPGGDSDSDSENDVTLSQLRRSRSQDSEEDPLPKSRKTKSKISASKSTKSARAKSSRAKQPSALSDNGSPLQTKSCRTSDGSDRHSRGDLSNRRIAPLPSRTKKQITVGESDDTETETEEDEDPLGLSSLSKGVPTKPAQRPVAKAPAKKPISKDILPSSDFSNIDSRWMLDVDDDEFDSQIPPKPNAMKTPSVTKKPSSHSMPPPSFIPARAMIKTPSTLNTSPFPTRKVAKKRILATSSDGEDGKGVQLSSATGNEASMFTSPLVTMAARRPTKRKDRRNVLVEDEVEVEGETTMGDDLSGEESESDRRFAGQFKPTQAPTGFNQRAAYLAGLATQARPGGPEFSDQSDKHDRFLAKARRPVFLSQEDREPREGPSSEYEGSFICGDDTVEFESEEDF